MLIDPGCDLCAAMAKDLRGGFQVRTFTEYPGGECMYKIIRPEPPGYSRFIFCVSKAPLYRFNRFPVVSNDMHILLLIIFIPCLQVT